MGERKTSYLKNDGGEGGCWSHIISKYIVLVQAFYRSAVTRVAFMRSF